MCRQFLCLACKLWNIDIDLLSKFVIACDFSKLNFAAGPVYVFPVHTHLHNSLVKHDNSHDSLHVLLLGCTCIISA